VLTEAEALNMGGAQSSLKDKAQMGHINFGGYDRDTATNYDLIERRNRHFAGSFLFYHDPVHIVRGEGAHLYDAEGQRYIDCYNNVQSMGHANPEIARAIAEQSAQLTTHTRYLNENVIELAEEVAATLPGDLEVCLFVCTGTEACELAMRIARVVTGSNGAIVMENSYHGNSKLVGEMSTATYAPQDRPPWIQAIEPPNTWRGPFRTGEGDDDELGRRYADLIDPAIEALRNNGEGLAAFVCDGIFDSNGALEAPADYFQQAYEKVRAAGGLCIADEVQAGICRTGTFWGFEHYDVVPDIVFTGKPFGGGYPVAAVFTTREIADAWAASDVYFNTFGGNPVAAAAAKAVIHFAQRERMPEHVRDVGAYLRDRLVALSHKHEIIGNIQGLGLFIGVDLVKDRVKRAPASEIAGKIPDAMKAEGVLIGLTGRFGNCLKFRPPLVFSKADVDATVEAFDRVLTRLVS
jgi:4-aminobutyrate aminotransferase-like enzyme